MDAEFGHSAFEGRGLQLEKGGSAVLAAYAPVRWLLNLAYMTLCEYPSQVPAKYRRTFDTFGSEFDIGRFKDIAHLVGVNRFNQAGDAVKDDFDNDGLLDLVVTAWDPAQSMAFYRNTGNGTFEDRTEAAGLSKTYGGLNSRADRLQQRWLPGHLHCARWVDSVADAAEPSAQQWQRHVHRCNPCREKNGAGAFSKQFCQRLLQFTRKSELFEVQRLARGDRQSICRQGVGALRQGKLRCGGTQA